MIPGIKKRSLNLYDLMLYVAIARKHLRLIFLLFALSAAGGLFFHFISRPVYHAQAAVRLEVILRPDDSDAVYRGTSGDVSLAQLTSPAMIERTAARFGIFAKRDVIYRKHLKRITIAKNTDRNLEVRVWAYSYELALKWTEVMVDEFLKYRDEQRLTYRESLIKSYTQEMDQVSQKLEHSVSEKFSFDEEQGTAESMIQLNQLGDVPKEIVAAKKQLALLDRTRASLDDVNQSYIEKLSILSSFNDQNILSIGQVLPPVPDKSRTGEEGEPATPAGSNIVVVPSMVKSGDQWQAIEKQRREIEEAMAQASKIYLPGNQKMIAFKKELNAVDQALKSEYEAARARFEVDYRSLLRKVADLELKLPEYQDANRKYRFLQQKSSMHEHGQLAWSKMFSKMLKQLTEVDFVEDKERFNLSYAGIVESSSNPVSPNPLRIAMLAFIAGICASVVVPFGIEYLDHTISDFSETESLFKIRGLGIIPVLDSKDVERSTGMDPKKQEQALLENFRLIRTNLLSIGSLTKEPHIIMVTSSLPKEGKTVISSNLALSFSQMGAKTLLVDADLRRGRIHRIFGLRKAPGLSALLTSGVELGDVCRPSGIENLDVMTAGEYLSTGTELLSSPKFAEVLDELRKRYDRIIVDTPPVLGLSETSVIQKMMDGVVFVAWSGQTPIKTMQVAVDMLQNNGANFYGFVLNRLDLSHATNYYQYYYYSNDYYRNYHALENA